MSDVSEPWVRTTIKRLASPASARQSAAWLLLLGAITLPLYLALRAGYPTKSFTSDPSTVGDFSWWKGSLSVAGSMMWAAAAMAFFLGSYADPRDRRYYVTMGVAVSWLAIDDTLRIHETIFPVFLDTSEKRAFALYAVGLLTVAWLNRKRILVRHPIPVVVWVAGMSMSIGMDVFVHGSDNKGTWFEDIPKVWALIALTTFAFLEARDAISRGRRSEG